MFRSAELTAPTPSSPPAARPQPSEPVPSPPSAPPAAPPRSNPTPTVPTAEGQVQLPPAPAPRVPPPDTAPAPKQTPVITAAEGAASPSAEQGIRELLKRYEQALEARNIDALKRIWPSLPGSQEQAVRTEFMHARRIEVDVDDPNIGGTGASGTVSFVRRYNLTTVDNQRPVTNSRTTMTVRRAGADWVIDSVRFETIR